MISGTAVKVLVRLRVVGNRQIVLLTVHVRRISTRFPISLTIYAIKFHCESLGGSYYNRADSYMKVRDYAKAADDFSSSIKKNLSNSVFLMNIEQFRRLHPEYDTVADNVLCEKLRSFFFPQMKYSDLAMQFLVNAKELNQQCFQTCTLNVAMLMRR
jgi:hypothetical protein